MGYWLFQRRKFISWRRPIINEVVVVKSLSLIWPFVTPWAAAYHASLSFIITQINQTHVHWVSDAVQPYHLCSPSPPALNLSSIRVFSSESALCNRWPKYWSFSFSISSSNKYPGLSSLRIDCFDLTVYETLKSLLQYHSSKASIIFYLNLFILIGA